ncbi:MAG: UDP-N-acetylmuramoyl-L-alanine--D-glutamate ligase [Hyphomicrobiaceae bacterium]
MIPLTTCAGRTIAVFGLGRSGNATCRALLAGGATVAAFDDGAEARAAASREGIPIVDLAAADWSVFDSLLLAPGVPLTHPRPHWTVERARSAGVEVIGDIELFLRERRAVSPASEVVAITGTNGKSTTTALIGHLLADAGRSVEVGGNIGIATLGLAPFADRAHYVLEVSSYQIDLTPSLDPTIGVLLNVTPDHIDRHGTFEAYARVKERLIEGARSAVVSLDDPVVTAIANRRRHAGGALKTFATIAGLSADLTLGPGGDVILREAPAASAFQLSGIASLRGAHNAQNAMAAIAVARLLGLDQATIQHGLEAFPGLAHRLEQVGTLAIPQGQVLFVNDSKATNADSTEKALSAFPSAIYWIAGGRAKEGGIESLRALFPRVAHAYLIGEAAGAFKAALSGSCPCTLAGTIDAAVELATRDAIAAGAAEAVVLLSPACASFDQFPNFEVRGEAFRSRVGAIPGVALAHGGDR